MLDDLYLCTDWSHLFRLKRNKVWYQIADMFCFVCEMIKQINSFGTFPLICNTSYNTLHTPSSVRFCKQLFIKYFFQSLRDYVFFTLQNLSVFTTLSMYSSLFNSNCCNGYFHVLNLYCSSVYIILIFTHFDYIWIFKNILEDDAEYNLGIYKVFNGIIGDSLSVTFLIAGKW